ncbi:MAG: hypothetical protein HYR55_11950 [Acidobacteria bacterium]|nr:hypothetical protein [Acidobacteriota bacterium]MBI3655880.1 hypothetical protein [Acidobacteriota bacterium]
MRTKLTIVLLSLAIVATMALNVMADCQNRIILSATPDGAAIASRGNAEVRDRGGRQRFKVSMEANVADGTSFFVYADGQSVGDLTIQLRRAEFEVQSDDFQPMPPELDPVCGVSLVEVVDADGSLILSGNF